MLTVLSAPILWGLISLSLGLIGILLRGRFTPQLYGYFELGRWGLIPYLALVFGHISPLFAGLSNLDWNTTFGVGLGLGFGLLTLAAITRVASHVKPSEEPRISIHSSANDADRNNISIRHEYWAWWLVRSCVQEVHWIFFRAAIWEAVLHSSAHLEQPFYTAIWFAGMVSLIEIFIHGRGSHQWIGQSATLLLTSVLFLYTRNLYLCCLLHAGMAVLLPRAFVSNWTEHPHNANPKTPVIEPL